MGFNVGSLLGILWAVPRHIGKSSLNKEQSRAGGLSSWREADGIMDKERDDLPLGKKLNVLFQICCDAFEMMS